jgi:hypothetical protein
MALQLEPKRRRRTKLGPVDRVLANRQLWKNAIYAIAFLTYLCSFLFFGLALRDVRNTGGSIVTIIDLIAAIYFLTQVIFLFVLSGVVERRRMPQRIDFPDRRSRN